MLQSTRAWTFDTVQFRILIQLSLEDKECVTLLLIRVWTGVELRPVVLIGTHSFGSRPGTVTALAHTVMVI